MTEGKETKKKYEDYVMGNIRIGDLSPDFTADTQDGSVSWHKYIEGSWAVLMSHPRDFTPVCTTEIGRVAQLTEEFAKRKVKVAVVSVDSAEEHKKWIQEINKVGETKVEFPIFADQDKKIACLYGMLDQTHLDQEGLPLTVRSLFVVGPDKRVKLTISYPASTGRNFTEVLRVIDSLQLAVSSKVATPVDWNKGQKVVILPAVPDDEARKLYPEFTVLSASCKLRMTPDPSAKA